MANRSSSSNLRKQYDSSSLFFELAKVCCFKKLSRVLIKNSNNSNSNSDSNINFNVNTNLNSNSSNTNSNFSSSTSSNFSFNSNSNLNSNSNSNNNDSTDNNIDTESYDLNSINKYEFPSFDNDQFAKLHIEHCLLRFQWQSNFSSPIEQRLLSGGIKILDVGCGNGAWILDMAREFNPSNTYIGIDVLSNFPSEDSRFPNTGFIQCNLLDGIPFPDSTFDFVFERFVVHLDLTNSQWKYLFSEMKRVLKPGGYLEIMEYCVDYDNPGPLTQARKAQILKYLNSKGIDPETTVCSIPQMIQSSLSLSDFQMQDRFGPIGCWGGDFGLVMLNNYEIDQKALNKVIKNFSDEELDLLNASITNEFDDYKTRVRNFRCFAQKKISCFDD